MIHPRILVAAVLFGACIAPTRADDDPDGKRWWSHVRFLADDRLEGRETGSEGHRKAAQYVADQFKRAGLVPVGGPSYFQTVKLESKEIDEPHSSLTLIRESGPDELVLGRDAMIGLRGNADPLVEAELVFAGHGLTISEAGHDDFKDIDVTGKVVAYLSGAPASIPGAGSPFPVGCRTRGEYEADRRSGRCQHPQSQEYGYPLGAHEPRSVQAVDEPGRPRGLDDTHGLKLGVTVNPAFADKWLAGTGHTMQQILDAADSNQPLPHFKIPARIKAIVAVKRAGSSRKTSSGCCRAVLPRLPEKSSSSRPIWITSESASRSRETRFITVPWTMPVGVASLIEVATRLA